jgi:hypothetical protein
MITRVPRELGRPRRLHRTCRPESRLTNSRMIRGPTSGAVGDEQRTHRWYRQAKETKCDETGGGESEHAIVLVKRGEPSLRDPAEGRACRVVDPWEGNTWRASHLKHVSTLCSRIDQRDNEATT